MRRSGGQASRFLLKTRTERKHSGWPWQARGPGSGGPVPGVHSWLWSTHVCFLSHFHSFQKPGPLLPLEFEAQHPEVLGQGQFRKREHVTLMACSTQDKMPGKNGGNLLHAVFSSVK